MIMLAPDDFSTFFQEVHGYEPFPWQLRLAKRVAGEGAWPEVLDLPTGSGKTSVIDIAVFHLALDAGQAERRRAPVRIAFVVDRRLVVDDAYGHAQGIAQRLADAQPGSVMWKVAESLRILSGDDQPLLVRRLRGGIPREDDWARTPAQPIVLCSTVDQIGSRLLFRGYGLSDRMKPVHAGLIGSDCMIFLDEAHLAEPFRQTLHWVSLYRGEKWRDKEKSHRSPWGVSLLTATPGDTPVHPFGLEAQDREHPILARRLQVAKPARIEQEKSGGEDEQAAFIAYVVKKVEDALKELSARGIENPAIGVVLNRVLRARGVFEAIREKLHGRVDEPVLLIGPTRPVDRNEVVKQALAPIRTRHYRNGEVRKLAQPMVIVATQCIEAGVDIDLDGLITEIAPIDALRQRFGRLNRAGRDIESYSVVIAMKSVLGVRYEDPVYGQALKSSWEYLDRHGEKSVFDFGIEAMKICMEEDPVPTEATSDRDDAPVLLPAHLDLLAQTSPVPAADPEVSLYLHGPNRQSDSITLVWRADLYPDRADAAASDNVRRLLLLAPPRSAEAIDLPLWTVRRWLESDYRALAELADVPTRVSDENERNLTKAPYQVFRWRGDDASSSWIPPSEIHPGDTIIVPAIYGGIDQFGWKGKSSRQEKVPTPVEDVAEKAASAFSGRRYFVRIAPGLVDDDVKDIDLANALASAASGEWWQIRDALLNLSLPEHKKACLRDLDDANGKRHGVEVHLDLYGYDDDRPRGVIFVARHGLRKRSVEGGQVAATEDDIAGSLPGYSLSLEQHSADVEAKAEAFARMSGLPLDKVADLKLAGYLHDAGKLDSRFQSWLQYGDPLGPDPDDPGQVFAKSGRRLPRHARDAAGLPDNWRHEALSVRLALVSRKFSDAKDPELVLWLIGTHHGYGRPFFPHEDPEDTRTRELPQMMGLPDVLEPGHGPQSLAFDWNGLDWALLQERLKARYGIWELARMEAILRLADHRASEDVERRLLEKEGKE